MSTDLVHTATVPALDPRNWSALAGDEPIGVSIDILDEDHSLKLALRRLATDARLRAALGANAHALWRRRFHLDSMAAGYAGAMANALHVPATSRAGQNSLPLHLRSTGVEGATELLQQLMENDAPDPFS